MFSVWFFSCGRFVGRAREDFRIASSAVNRNSAVRREFAGGMSSRFGCR